MILLFLSALPFAVLMLTNHPDERHYRDAALNMVTSGDWLTPRTAEQPLRLRKPIITYWMVAISYTLLGSSPLASRLPFLLTACATIWLTYRLALLLTGNTSIARLAAFIMACHPALFISAQRSIPDMPLCFFLLLSAYGFLALIVHDRPAPLWMLAAYGGSGLAVATKGLPPAAFVVVSVTTIALHPQLKGAKRWLAHLPWALLGGLVAASWFAVMYVLHGDELLTVLFKDQVSDRLDRPFWKPAVQFPQYLLMATASFLPWIVPLWRRTRWRFFSMPNVSPQRRRGLTLIVAWTLSYLLAASFVERVNLRYLLPLAPLLSIPVAAAVSCFGSRVMNRWAQYCLAGSCVALLSTSVLAMGSQALFQHAVAVVLIGTVALSVLAIVAIWFRGRAWQNVMACSAAVALMAPPMVFLAAAPLMLPDVGQTICQQLQAAGVTHGPVLLVGRPKIATRLRLFGHNALAIHYAPEWYPHGLERYNAIVLATSQGVTLDSDAFRIEHCHDSPYRLTVGGILDAFVSGHLREHIDDQRPDIVIAIPRQHEFRASPDIAQVPR